MNRNFIIVRENEENSIEQLAAQRVLYKQAKVLFTIQSLFCVCLLVLLSFAQLIFSTYNFTIVIASVSLFVMFLDNMLEEIISNKKEQASKVQEMFDTYVLNIEWNSILCGDHPEHNEVYNAVKKFDLKKDTEKLKNWYDAPIDQVSESAGALICQKINCIYDRSIRKRFNNYIVTISIIAIVLILFFTFCSGITAAKLLLTFIFPALPIIQWCVKIINANEKSLSSIQTINSLINLNFEKVKNKKNIEPGALRQIQDGIFLTRRTNPLIPDWFYNKVRTPLELEATYTISKLVKEVL